MNASCWCEPKLQQICRIIYEGLLHDEISRNLLPCNAEEILNYSATYNKSLEIRQRLRKIQVHYQRITRKIDFTVEIINDATIIPYVGGTVVTIPKHAMANVITTDMLGMYLIELKCLPETDNIIGWVEARNLLQRVC